MKGVLFLFLCWLSLVYATNNCGCPDYMMVVCSTTGKNFDNLCKMKCHNELLQNLGDCETATKKKRDVVGCTCNEDYTPVCGTDGKTYSNECHMTCSGATKMKDGECKSSMLKNILENY